jgi:hypothetical protein
VDDTIRSLMTVGFACLLILLRLDAFRFGAAEYDDDLAPGGWRVGSLRLAWYVLGLVLAGAIVAVRPVTLLPLGLSVGNDRLGSLMVGLLAGAAGCAVAAGFAWYRYRRFRLPDGRLYPGAIANSVGTALIDEITFRGAVMGLLLAAGVPTELAVLAQALLYGIATRLGAAGRSHAMLAIFLGLGIAAGWVTLLTGGIGAAVVGHAITRFAIFLATGHPGQVRPPGEEPEELEASRLPPEGWEVVGGRQP